MRKKYDKTEIIEKGVQLFREKGYHDTGVDDILNSCKIPSGSFYNFFKSKEGFALQALEYYNLRYIEYLDKVLNDKNQSPLNRLRTMFEENVKDHVGNDCSKGCLLNNMTSEVAALNPNISTTAEEHYRRNSEKIAETIREGQESGEIRKDYDAIDLAFYLIDGFSGASVRMKAGRTDQPLRLFLRTTVEFLKA